MSQDEVLKFLESVRNMYVDANEISRNTNKTVKAIKISLKKLLEQDEVIFVKGPDGKTRLWGLKETKNG